MAQKLSLKHWPIEIMPGLPNPPSLAQSVHRRGEQKHFFQYCSKM